MALAEWNLVRRRRDEGCQCVLPRRLRRHDLQRGGRQVRLAVAEPAHRSISPVRRQGPDVAFNLLEASNLATDGRNLRRHRDAQANRQGLAAIQKAQPLARDILRQELVHRLVTHVIGRDWVVLIQRRLALSEEDAQPISMGLCAEAAQEQMCCCKRLPEGARCLASVLGVSAAKPIPVIRISVRCPRARTMV